MSATCTVIRNRRPIKQSQKLLVMWIAVALVNISSGSGLIAARRQRTQSAAVPQTTTVTMLPGTTQAIKVGPDNQTNPHVDGHMASYTGVDDFFGSSQIYYFDFATNVTQAVPGNGVDLLSDIAGS